MEPEFSSRMKRIAPGLVFLLLINAFSYGQQSNAKASDGSSQNQPDQARPVSSTPGTSPILNESSDALPDSPGAVHSAQVANQPDLIAQEQSSSRPQDPSAPEQPVGTAAAESIPIVGTAASRPAGAAVAPAKQRRVRSFLIKMGAVVGVGVAVGATVALSEGSPSRPPGSH